MQTFQCHPDPGAGPRPPSDWREAVIEFAQNRKLPVDEVLRGSPFTCNAYVFRLQYNVEVDSRGLVVLLDLGEIPVETAHVVRMEMLTNNARTPSALLGYFGILPGTRRGAYCVRLDRQKLQDPAFAIAAVVEALANSVDASYVSMKQAFQDLIGINPDQMQLAPSEHRTQ